MSLKGRLSFKQLKRVIKNWFSNIYAVFKFLFNLNRYIVAGNVHSLTKLSRLLLSCLCLFDHMVPGTHSVLSRLSSPLPPLTIPRCVPGTTRSNSHTLYSQKYDLCVVAAEAKNVLTGRRLSDNVTVVNEEEAAAAVAAAEGTDE